MKTFWSCNYFSFPEKHNNFVTCSDPRAKILNNPRCSKNCRRHTQSVAHLPETDRKQHEF